MADWEENSSQLGRNLNQVRREIRDVSRRREILIVEDARGWHRGMMYRLDARGLETQVYSPFKNQRVHFTTSHKKR